MDQPPRFKAIALAAIGLGITAFAQQARADLISYHGFEDNLDNAVSGAPDGTAIGDPTYVTGQFGQALSLDGNDAVNTGTGAYPNATKGLAVGGVVFWIKTTQTSSFVVSGALNDGFTTAWQFQMNTAGTDVSTTFDDTNAMRMYIRDDDNQYQAATVAASAAGNWTDGEWHHIALTWDTANFASTAQFYVDGVAVTTTRYSTLQADNFSAWDYDLTIGARNPRGTLDNYLTGQLDEYAVFDHVLTQTDIDQLVAGTYPGPSAGPRITSFTSVGTNLWELTLSGEANTAYEFYSSTTLEFTPGTLLEGLTQGDSVNDPGDIGGTNSSVLTADANGDGKVRLTLTGNPADFVRAQSVP